MDIRLSERIVQHTGFAINAETWPRKKAPTQICLHHTASGPGTIGDVTWWQRDGQPVSTPLIVDRDGTALQVYSSRRWAFHLGLKNQYYREVEEVTIGLEIDSWGSLVMRNGKFYAWPNNYGVEVPENEVFTLSTQHRGCSYYHKYTDAQIETTRLLLIEWNETYKIPLTYKELDLWHLSQAAQFGKEAGIYSHNSFRADKNDIFPQPEMVYMLKNIR